MNRLQGTAWCLNRSQKVNGGTDRQPPELFYREAASPSSGSGRNRRESTDYAAGGFCIYLRQTSPLLVSFPFPDPFLIRALLVPTTLRASSLSCVRLRVRSCLLLPLLNDSSHALDVTSSIASMAPKQGHFDERALERTYPFLHGEQRRTKSLPCL